MNKSFLSSAHSPAIFVSAQFPSVPEGALHNQGTAELNAFFAPYMHSSFGHLSEIAPVGKRE